jgi:hypothetical protein
VIHNTGKTNQCPPGPCDPAGDWFFKLGNKLKSTNFIPPSISAMPGDTSGAWQNPFRSALGSALGPEVFGMVPARQDFARSKN